MTTNTSDQNSVNTETASPELKIFAFDSSAVRVLMHGNEPWFIAKDICNILEIENPTQAIARLDEDEKGSLCLTEGTSPKGGNPNHTIVSESGLYCLVLRCRKAVKPGTIAHSFRKWVTSEVLPQIRQTGHYRHTPQPAAVSIPEQYVTLTHFDASIAIIDQNTKALQACALGLTNALQRITALETRQAKLENALRQIQTSVTQALSLFHPSTPSLRN